MVAFYEKAMKDDVIGYLFTDIAKLDLDHHLPIIGDFWETMLFRGGDYGRHGRNPLAVHGDLDQKSPILKVHFDRWIEIFNEMTDDLFEGETADFIKFRAKAIAGRMLEHISQRRSYGLTPQQAV